MARTTLSHPFDTMSGKLTRTDKIILRTRNGNTHAYAIRNPYKGPVAPERQRTLDAFASAVAQAKNILTTPLCVRTGNSVSPPTPLVPTAIRPPTQNHVPPFAATSSPLLPAKPNPLIPKAKV